MSLSHTYACVCMIPLLLASPIPCLILWIVFRFHYKGSVKAGATSQLGSNREG